MIEFIMSRVWLIIAAFAVVGVVLTAFNGLDERTNERAAIDGANVLTGLMNKLRTNGEVGAVQIDGRDVIIDGHHSLRICNGSIWICNGKDERAVDGPQDITLVDGESTVDVLTISRSDLVVLRSFFRGDGSIGLQLEKVEVTSLTASTNLLHSSSVL